MPNSRDRAMRRLLSWLLVFGWVIASAQTVSAEEAKPKKQATAGQVMERAKKLKAAGEKAATTAEQMLKEAKAAKPVDMTRVNCINEKIPKITSNASSAGEWSGKITTASPQADVDQANAVLDVIALNLQTLIQEVNQCAGQAGFSAGETKIETQIDKTLMPADESAKATPTLLPPSVPVIPTNASGKM